MLLPTMFFITFIAALADTIALPSSFPYFLPASTNKGSNAFIAVVKSSWNGTENASLARSPIESSASLIRSRASLSLTPISLL